MTVCKVQTWSVIMRSNKLVTKVGQWAIIASVASLLPCQVAYADIIQADDVIINGGSLCVGLDCVNGESFSFDTIRLKENNLRIHFNDTSNSASFPTNDWRIVINDTTNGGDNYFGIEDSTAGRLPFRIFAGARANALVVDSQGDVGFGTSNPVTEIHSVRGDTPTLRLEQDNSSGWTPQTWDLAGNESNFFVRDVTNGSLLPFKIKPSAPTNSLFVDTDGDIGLGTASPDAELDIEGNGSPGLRLSNTGTAGGSWDLFMNSNTGRMNLRDNSTSNIPVKIEDGSNDNLLRIGIDTAGASVSNQVSIDGNLVVTGTITPDYVFDTDYQLESIEEHSAYMWKYKHLPAVGAGVKGENGKYLINVAKRSQGVLEELEKAHIYIEQLHVRLRDKESKLNRLEARLKKLESRL